MPVNDKSNWTLDEASGFLAPKVPEVCGNSMLAVSQKQKFLDIFQETYDFGTAARAVGVKTRTVYDHLAFDKGFKAAYEEAIEVLCSESQSALVKQMRKGNIAAAFGILKRYRPEWRDRAMPPDPAKVKAEETKSLLDKFVKDGLIIDVEEASGDR
jgi:hypothetical protein